MKNAFDIINKLYMSFDQKASIDLVKYPLLTEKTIKLIEQNQYSFAVSSNATKTSVKVAIEQLFDVKVVSVNTSLQALKKRRVGKFIGKKTQYKRAIVTLAPENSITLFEDV
jgi:large subunit ribosomal protein L23|tara:strand:+ start:98 stop:433 length:336 start_codon:yes stop_codon:yes gene_type:complete